MNVKPMTLKAMLVFILIAAILSGCSLQAATLPATITVPTALPTSEVDTQPTTAPTVDLQPTLDAAKTQAVQTVVAELTLNAPTVTPTDTATAIITKAPTFTPVPPTATLIPWTSTPKYTATPIYTPTPLGYACSVTSTSPKPTDLIKVNVDFDGNWTVKNTGTITWSASAVDFKYISGTKFQTKADLFDFKSDVVKDASYSVIVDMKAPADAGIYTATWAVVQYSLTLCTLNLSVTVVK